MDKYNKILRKVEQRLGNTTTYDFQLEDLGRELLGSDFRGVFPLDRIPIILVNGYYIINLDKSYEPCSHWCAFVKDKKKSIFYDSFGRTQELKKIPELSRLNFSFTDDDSEQFKTETNCGARCISWCILHYLYGDQVALSI
jgi:hypothetical protein